MQWKNNLLMILGSRAQIQLHLPMVEGSLKDFGIWARVTSVIDEQLAHDP
jgi:hypothetical protein